MRRYLIIFVVLVFGQTLQAQVQENLLMERFNMNAFNPAFVGSEGREVSFTTRSSWQGVSGSPKMSYFFYSGNPKKNLSLGASVFLHNDTIFKYGGYGYWSQRNFMTYYNKSSKEWEVYRQNNTYLPIGSYNGLNFKQKQKVYFFGGSKVDIK
ncbi:type IX secretion system membrane protein PorP/SprF, partial [Flavobacteriaceae bacterium]|nr:type IX secretion system membrane protein PorP/SprF [Flavobacteriaceae bacterium]